MFFIQQTAALTPFRLTLPAISHLDMLGLKSEKYVNSEMFLLVPKFEERRWNHNCKLNKENVD